MSTAAKASDKMERDQVRDQIIDLIRYMNTGMRRGLNHDVKNVGPELSNLVDHLLARDKYYKWLRKRAKYRRCLESAKKANRRKRLFHEIVGSLYESHSLYYLETRRANYWSLLPSFVDDHLGTGTRSRKKKFFNDHTFHGKPRRARQELLRHLA